MMYTRAPLEDITLDALVIHEMRRLFKLVGMRLMQNASSSRFPGTPRCPIPLSDHRMKHLAIS